MHGAAAVLCGTLLGEPRKEDVCRLGDVTARQLLRLPRVPSDYRVQDILVLVPNPARRLIPHQHLGHQASSVQPMRLHRVPDQPVPRNLVEKFVKLDVSIDQLGNRKLTLGPSALFDELGSLPCRSICAAAGGKTGRKPFSDRAYLVKVPDEFDIQRSNLQPAARAASRTKPWLRSRRSACCTGCRETTQVPCHFVLDQARILWQPARHNF